MDKDKVVFQNKSKSRKNGPTSKMEEMHFCTLSDNYE